MRDRPARQLLTVLVFVAALVFVLAVQARERRLSGFVRLHWASEDLIQTVPFDDLAAEPLRSLWYLHVQPPALDLLRAALLALPPRPPSGHAAAAVDDRLGWLWAGVYASVVTLSFVWLRRVASPLAALAAAVAVAAHPSALLYATVPDTTLLTAFLVAWSSYETWLLASAGGSVPRAAGAFLALFLVRSVYQWPALLVYTVVVALRGVGWRRTALFLALTAPLVVGYAVKQRLVFGTSATTSFTGYNCLRSLGILPFGFDRGQALPLPSGVAPAIDPRAARVLSTTAKANGMPNFNNASYLVVNRMLLDACRREYASRTWRELVSAYAVNLELYLRPSSRYASAQPVLTHVAWREPFEWVFSGWRWVALLASAVALWLAKVSGRSIRPASTGSAPRSGPSETGARAILRGAALALPLSMVAAVSVLFERGENMRFRFFVEPTLLVFVAAQLYGAASHFRGSTPPAPPSPAGPAGSPGP